jgi:hypothetical protein
MRRFWEWFMVMMLNTGNRNRVVLLGASGNRTVRSLKAHGKNLAHLRARPHPSLARRLLDRVR